MGNSTGDLDADRLCAGWSPRRVGRHVTVLPEVDSTNRAVLAELAGGGEDGLVVMADFQTAGRGRLGRGWLSPRGASVLCSIGLVEQGSAAGPEFGGLLTLVSAVAACEAVRGTSELTPTIKWPNDLLVAGRKLGGILIESRAVGQGRRAWAVGMGINCLQHAGHFPEELKSTAVSLEQAVSHPVDRAALARQLLQRLDDWLSGPADARRVHEAWLSFAEPLGQPMRVRCDGREVGGRTLDVDPAGGLILQCDDGRREWFDPLRTSVL